MSSAEAADGGSAPSKSGFLSSVFNWHTAVHATLMAGMVFTGVAAISAALPSAVTFGDFFVQAGHMCVSMVDGLISDGIPTITEMFSSAVNGNFAPTTLENAHNMHALAATHGGAGAGGFTAAQSADIAAAADRFGVGSTEYSQGFMPQHR